jgi:hypothetical protein
MNKAYSKILNIFSPKNPFFAKDKIFILISYKFQGLAVFITCFTLSFYDLF